MEAINIKIPKDWFLVARTGTASNDTQTISSIEFGKDVIKDVPNDKTDETMETLKKLILESAAIKKALARIGSDMTRMGQSLYKGAKKIVDEIIGD